MWKLAWRNTLRHSRRSSAAIGAIAFGTVALLLSGGFIEWILLDFREHIIHSQLGHVQIAKRGFGQLGAADPFAFLMTERDVDALALAKSPDIVAVAPRLGFSGLVSAGDTTVSFVGEGLDPALERDLSRGLTLRAGSMLDAADPQGVLVGAGLAEALAVKPGDKIVLLATTRSGGTNALEARVRGVFTSVAKAYDDTAIRVPIGMARQLLKVRGMHKVVLLLDSTDRTDEVVRSLTPRAEAAGLEVKPWWALADFYSKTKVLFSQQIGVLRAIIAAIVILSVSNTMIMTVLERTWEIGTVMALGTSRRRVLIGFLQEAFLLGSLGSALGLIAGIAAAYVISAIGIPMPPPPGMANGYIGRILLTPGLAVQALVLGVITALIAGAYPAWRAARLPIIDALRHNH